jgi:hypothetical protein
MQELAEQYRNISKYVYNLQNKKILVSSRQKGRCPAWIVFPL